MITTCIFDAYGTLFDVASAARNLAASTSNEILKNNWQSLANTWRLKQLQYTWLRTIMEQHADFWQVTQDGLDFALEEAKLNDPNIRAELLDLYWELAAYPEASHTLQDLKNKFFQTGILSNGSPKMLHAAVTSAGLLPLLDKVISIEDIGIYKPDPRVYQMVLDQYNCTTNEVLFVSANGWDIAGANAFGFTTLWVNRLGEPQDRLGQTPWKTQLDLANIPKLLEGIS